EFAKTDLELAQNGYLYMAGDPSLHFNAWSASSIGGPLSLKPGYLAYINTTGLTLATAATTAPTYVGSPASVSTNGIIDVHLPDIDHGNGYYLQNQIDVDNYSSYFTSASTPGGVTLDGNILPTPSCAPDEIKAGMGSLTFSPGLSPSESVSLQVYTSDACV